MKKFTDNRNILINQGYFLKKVLNSTKKWAIREEWYNPLTQQLTYNLISFKELKGEK